MAITVPHGALASPVSKTVKASGLAVILDGDVASAFEEAKRAALREAVEEAVGVLVSSTTRVRNFQLIEDRVLAETSGYVRAFSVLERHAVDEDTYEVIIEAEVDLGSLTEGLSALDLLMEQAGRPRIWYRGQEYLVDDQGQRTALDWRVAEAEVVRAMSLLQGDLFSLVPAGENGLPAGEDGVPPRMQGQASGGGVGGPADLSASADIAVIAEVEVRSGSDASIPMSSKTLAQIGLTTAIASVELRAFWTDTGASISTLAGETRAAASGFTQAGRKAVRCGVGELADKLAVDVVSDLRSKVYSRRSIQLFVRAEAPQLRRFEESFPAHIGAVELLPRSYHSGLATYDMRTSRAAFQVARQLSLGGLEELEIEIVQVSANSLKIQLAD